MGTTGNKQPEQCKNWLFLTGSWKGNDIVTLGKLHKKKNLPMNNLKKDNTPFINFNFHIFFLCTWHKLLECFQGLVN